MLRLAMVLTLTLTVCPSATAQPPPSWRIGPFVVDLRGTFPNFPTTVPLASSRGVGSTDLPGLGLGIAVGAHLYLLRWRVITFGFGGELMAARAHSTPAT